MSECPKCGYTTAVRLTVFFSDSHDIFICPKCRYEWLSQVKMPKMTNGDKLRMMSNEELADKLVYSTYIKRKKPLYDWKRRQIANKWFLCVVWKSSVTSETYSTKAEAFSATVAKLNEVEK